MNLTKNNIKIALDYLIALINEAGIPHNFSITSDDITSTYIEYASFIIDVRSLDDAKQKLFGTLISNILDNLFMNQFYSAYFIITNLNPSTEPMSKFLSYDLLPETLLTLYQQAVPQDKSKIKSNSNPQIVSKLKNNSEDNFLLNKVRKTVSFSETIASFHYIPKNIPHKNSQKMGSPYFILQNTHPLPIDKPNAIK